MSVSKPLLHSVFWGLFSLFSAASILTRFDLFAPYIPSHLLSFVLFFHGPIVFMTGYLEANVHAEDHDLPRLFRLAVTLAFTFLSVVCFQELDIGFGPIDPTPPAAFPPLQRLAWFLTFSFGMGFANFMAADNLLLPVVRGLVRPFRKAILPVGLLLSGTMGFVLAMVLRLVFAGSIFARAEEWIDRLSSPWVAVAAGLLFTALVGRLSNRE